MISRKNCTIATILSAGLGLIVMILTMNKDILNLEGGVAQMTGISGLIACCHSATTVVLPTRKYFNEDHNIHGDEDRDDVEKLDEFCEYKCKIETP